MDLLGNQPKSQVPWRSHALRQTLTSTSPLFQFRVGGCGSKTQLPFASRGLQPKWPGHFIPFSYLLFMLWHSTTIRFSFHFISRTHQPSPSTTSRFSKVCVGQPQVWHCAIWTSWVTNPNHRSHDAAMLYAKLWPPLTLSRTMLDCSHFAHTLTPVGHSLANFTFTNFSAKCHPQAVLHESKLNPHAAKVTMWAVFLLLFVEMAHRLPTSGALTLSPKLCLVRGLTGSSSSRSFSGSSISFAGCPETFPPRSPRLLTSNASFRNGSLMALFSKSSLFAGKHCNASSMYRNTAEDFHLPRKLTPATSMPHLV